MWYFKFSKRAYAKHWCEATATALPPELPPTDIPVVPYETAPYGVFSECELRVDFSNQCLCYSRRTLPHAEFIQISLPVNDSSGGLNLLHYGGSIWADEAIQ